MFSVAVFAISIGLCAASDVLELTASNYDALTKNQVTLTKFYAPWCGHCKSLAPTWEKAATALKGKAQIGKVDCTQHVFLCQQFNVQGYPTLILQLKDGSLKEFDGARTVEAIEKFIADPSAAPAVTRNTAAAAEAPAAEENDAAASGPTKVIELDAANFDKTVEGKSVFIKFYAPWCGFCKAIAGDWNKLSLELDDAKSATKIAKIDCTVQANKKVCSSFNVGGYPTLILVAPDGSAKSFEGGDRSIAKLKEFIADPSTGTTVVRPFVLRTGVAFIDDNFPMMRDDMISLYNYKKAALGLTFGVGTVFGLLLSLVLCGGGSKGGKSKRE